MDMLRFVAIVLLVFALLPTAYAADVPAPVRDTETDQAGTGPLADSGDPADTSGVLSRLLSLFRDFAGPITAVAALCVAVKALRESAEASQQADSRSGEQIAQSEALFKAGIKPLLTMTSKRMPRLLEAKLHNVGPGPAIVRSLTFRKGKGGGETVQQSRRSP